VKYLIDTCVLSECIKRTPNSLVAQWFNDQEPTRLYLSSITIAEIKKGLYKIQTTQPDRFDKLENWLFSVEEKFNRRILPITENILDKWAEISANAELNGGKLAVMDSLIAATAYEHKLTLVTRNVDDFKRTPIEIINPYIILS
jgi:predicted nucleic acid-binding protein